MPQKAKEIIVALIAVFGVVVPYLFQKNKELHLKIAEQKRRAYARFLRNFTETAIAVMHDEDVSGRTADRKRMRARDQLLLYASDEVIKAYGAWIRYADSEQRDLNREGELISLIFLAIRKDLLGKTKVRKEHLENLNPFTQWAFTTGKMEATFIFIVAAAPADALASVSRLLRVVRRIIQGSHSLVLCIEAAQRPLEACLVHSANGAVRTRREKPSFIKAPSGQPGLPWTFCCANGMSCFLSCNRG